MNIIINNKKGNIILNDQKNAVSSPTYFFSLKLRRIGQLAKTRLSFHTGNHHTSYNIYNGSRSTLTSVLKKKETFISLAKGCLLLMVPEHIVYSTKKVCIIFRSSMSSASRIAKKNQFLYFQCLLLTLTLRKKKKLCCWFMLVYVVEA